ncbi:hypothetical protein LV779_15160 [Streptomyces thinghirensis]|nr:hypothetical protein [Streptomyces thinghirensis]
MQRGSDRMSVHRDDEMEARTAGSARVRAPHPYRGVDDPEPAAEDDPDVTLRTGDTRPRTDAYLEALRLELARNLTRGTFLREPRGVTRGALRGRAPDASSRDWSGCRTRRAYDSVKELAVADRSGGSGPTGTQGA